jgi:hypothetical protein
MRKIGLAVIGMALACAAGCRQHMPSEADVLNVEAKLPQDWPVPALDWRMISSGVDRAHGTMSMLTGNDLAVKNAGAKSYPQGAKLALVTWLERDDPHWFGGRIAGTFVSLETIEFEPEGNGQAGVKYRRYAGNPLHEVANPEDAQARTAYALGMGASEMP